MFAYDKTFDHKVILGHRDLISWFIDFALYLDTQYIFILLSDYDYDQTFDLKVLIGHCDLISELSDFVLYLGTQYVNILLSQYVCL